MSEFIGRTDIKHVAQPEGSELCFATILSSVTNSDINTVHQNLTKNQLSSEDGSTHAPMASVSINLEKVKLAVDPIVTPLEFDISSSEVMDRIYEEFNHNNPVALMHKKNGDMEDAQYHWSLLLGRHIKGGTTEYLTVMDPLQPAMMQLSPAVIENCVTNSLNFVGVGACALSVAK